MIRDRKCPLVWANDVTKNIHNALETNIEDLTIHF